MADPIDRERTGGCENGIGRADRTVMDPIGYRLGEVYAQALLDLLDDNQAEQVHEELARIAGLLDELDGFEQLLTAAVLNDRARLGLIQRVFGGRVSKSAEGLLAAMARNGRLGFLREVVRRFRKLLNRRQGKVEVVITTAVEMDRATRRRIVESLRDALGAEPLLRTVVDENVLGGMVMRTGDRVYDASLAAGLKRLREALLKERATASPA